MQVIHILSIVILALPLASALLVDDVREDIIQKMNDAWLQLKTSNGGGGNGKKAEIILKDLSSYLKNLPPAIGRLERELQLEEYEDALQSLFKFQNVSSHWKNKWTEISVLMSPVDVLYGHFKVFVDMPQAFLPGEGNLDFDASTVADLILKPIYHSDEEKGSITLSFLLDRAHSTVVSSYNYRETNAFEELKAEINKAVGEGWCLHSGKTPQRLIYGFYVSLLTLDIKAYTIKNFAHMLNYAINGTSTDPLPSKQILRNQAHEKMEAAKAAIASASSAYWKCDPKIHAEGESYEEFKELLQGVIENEKDMHPKGSCKQVCADFTFTESRCTGSNCILSRRCTGDLIDCSYVAADATVCPADAPRRFDYIDYKRGPLLGKTGKCSKPTERRDSHWRFWYHCSNCLCLCDDPNSPSTVRHISLTQVTSNTTSNKIVTGVRFVMKDGILRLQIEEGVPARRGAIQDGSTEWKTVPILRKTSLNVAKLDYFHRSLDLDDIKLSENYVVTGVKFNRLGGHFGLMVQATQINPITAELMPSTSHWVGNDNTADNYVNPRREFALNDVDVPTYSPKASVPDTVHDQYLHFGPTSRTKDVAQTTIPFIDIQPVRPQPASWLKGVGIYHKGQPGYGGYIAPRVFTSDVTEFMDTDVK